MRNAWPMDSSGTFTGLTTLAPDTGQRTLHVGEVIDGFRLEERLHQGGMANLWRVTRVAAPAGAPADELLMKVPRIKGGEDPATIVEIGRAHV